MTTEFTVTCTLTATEEARARRVNYYRKKSSVVGFGVLLLIIAALVSPEVLDVLRGDEPLNSLMPPFWTLSGLGVIWWVIFRFFTPGSRATGGDKEVTVSSEGVSSQSPVARRLLYWVNFTSALETGDFILLRIGGQSLWAIPKRDIVDSAVLQGLRDLIRAHVPDTRLLDRPQ